MEGSGPVQRAAHVALAAMISTAPLSPGRVLGHDTRSPDPNELLKESYSLGKGLLPSERAFHLFVLADVASRLSPSAASANWARELFRLTLALPNTWNRGALQKNALVSLSRANAPEALALLSKADPPVAESGDFIAEDLRAFAARTVFEAYWKARGSPGIAQIRQEARRIGDTGLYPFVAVAPIYRDYTQATSASTSAPWFREVLAYYERRSAVASRHSEYVEFLDAVWPVLTQAQRQDALHLAVSSLTRRTAPEPNTSYSATLQDGEKTVQLRSLTQRLLQDLLPRVRDLDPMWATRLAQENALNGASDSSLVAETWLRGPVRFSADAPDLQERAFESQQIRRIQAVASTSAEEALELARGLSQPDLQAEGVAIVASAVSKHDRDRAKQLVEEARRDLEQVREPNDVLRTLLAIADAASESRDAGAVAGLTSQALALGEELYGEFVQTAPMTPLYNAPFFQDLARLTRFATREDAAAFLERVRKLPQRTLRAYLLPYCAEGIQESREKRIAQDSDTSDDAYVIGIALRSQPGCPHIVWGVTNSSPAAVAGIRAGDHLLAIDGQSLAAVDGQRVAALIMGNGPGPVSLSLGRNDDRYSAVVDRERLSAVLARSGLKLVQGAIVRNDTSEAEVARMMTFDSSHVVYRLFPVHYPTDSDVYYGGFEVFVLQQRDDVLVGGIEEGPAQDAGLRWGDRILSVEGIDPRRKSSAELEHMFSSQREKSISLRVERGGTVQTITFTLDRASAIMARNGVRLDQGQIVPAGLSSDDARCLAKEFDVGN